MKNKADPQHPFFDRYAVLVASAQKYNHKTLRKIAKEAGIFPSSLSYYHDRKFLPSVENLLKLADYFGVSTDYLLGKEDDETEEEST